MLGSVRVPITGRVAERPDGPVMRLRVAKSPLPADSPFQYVILRRDPGRERFVIWLKTREPVVEYRPTVPGSYEFVMRLKNTDSARQTGPSGDSPVLALELAG